MIPIPMLIVNGDICKNVREYNPRQICVTTCGGGDAVIVCHASVSHLTVISVMVIMGDGYTLCVSKLFI